VSKLSKCEIQEYAFDVDIKSLSCKVDHKTEFMIYETEAECKKALKAMEANAP